MSLCNPVGRRRVRSVQRQEATEGGLTFRRLG